MIAQEARIQRRVRAVTGRRAILDLRRGRFIRSPRDVGRGRTGRDGELLECSRQWRRIDSKVVPDLTLASVLINKTGTAQSNRFSGTIGHTHESGAAAIDVDTVPRAEPL